MQVVAARIGYANINALNTGLLLCPIVAELGLSAQGSLGRCQCMLMSPKTIEGRVAAAIAQGREADDPHVDTYRRSSRHRALDLPHCQDGDEPFFSRSADGGAPYPPQDIPAVAVAQPTESRQKNSAIGLIELEFIRV